LATIRPGAARRERQSIEEAFPVVDPLIGPLGNGVIVQMRRPKQRTAGGIIMAAESQDWDASMIRIAKVIAMGPLAYRKRETLEAWPEGAWVKVGDYVRVPAHAGVDGWKIFLNENEWVQFAVFNDYDLKGIVLGDPLDIIDYV
jgi:co-chaperonin GroES (HSP10)